MLGRVLWGVGVMIALLVWGYRSIQQAPVPVQPPVQVKIQEGADFRIFPYLQHPRPDGMTLMWFTEQAMPSEVEVEGIGRFYATPTLATALDYSPAEQQYLRTQGAQQPRQVPYQHRVQLKGLKPQTRYLYHVYQAGQRVFSASLNTAPLQGAQTPLQLVVMSDMETQPESSGQASAWSKSDPLRPMHTDPHSNTRKYLVDQTTGYRQTLAAAAKLQPDLWLISGDLTAKGGRQLDWDEFWQHAAGQWGQLASSTVILPVMGNHDNYWHPEYSTPYHAEAVKRAYAKWRSYWDMPSNQASQSHYQQRYYRTDYGPITLISLDSSNGDDRDVQRDSNLLLDGHAAGVPDFNIGSEQWQWAEQQLHAAAAQGQIIFVQWHHMAYGTGLHSFASGWAGLANSEDKHSGLPMRIYHPLMQKYGVVAVFSGHNEILETVSLDGVQYWDVGFSGDGLRGSGDASSTDHIPWDLLPKAAQESHWSAHANMPEVWQGQQLLSGGKHYGFLSVQIEPRPKQRDYEIVMQAHYALPITDAQGAFTGQFSPQLYPKKVVVHRPFKAITRLL